MFREIRVSTLMLLFIFLHFRCFFILLFANQKIDTRFSFYQFSHFFYFFFRHDLLRFFLFNLLRFRFTKKKKTR